MTQEKKSEALAQGSTITRSPMRKDLPGWTNGLRELYDKVVDEDLPDSFRDLLSRLDEDK